MKKALIILVLFLFGCSKESPTSPVAPSEQMVDLRVSYNKPTVVKTTPIDFGTYAGGQHIETTSYDGSCPINQSPDGVRLETIAIIPNSPDSTTIHVKAGVYLTTYYNRIIIYVNKKSGLPDQTGTVSNTRVDHSFQVLALAQIWNIP